VYVLELAGQDDAFAAREADRGATAIERLAPGLATARGIGEGFYTLALTHRASTLVGTADATVDDARRLLEASALSRTGTVAVRAVDVRGSTGVDTQAAERALGDALVERGFAVDLDDPDHVLRALFSAGDSGGTCALGWLAAETVRDYGDRWPTDRPFFQPGSMGPLEARALANLARAGPGRCVLDPFCGTGGILLEAALVGADVLGGDAQARMVAGAARNLRHAVAGPGRSSDDRYPAPGDWALYRGDAARVPVATDAVDAVVFDPPYGRQSRIEGDLATLVGDALAEARRVASRAVLVGDRCWEGAAVDAGWTVEARFERRVHRSLVRHVHLLV
jgi:tRNA (guanine10-N2)-dimethyltransferase